MSDPFEEERKAAMYQRVLMSMMLTVAFSLAIFVQATSAKPVSSQVMQQSSLVSEKVAGLNLGVESQKPASMTSAEYRALMIRSEALNRKYAVEGSAKPIVSEKLGGLQLPATSTTTFVTSSGSEFDWSDAGIGAGVVFGTMLLGAGLVLTVRRRDFPIVH
jgi:hypothetical protein